MMRQRLGLRRENAGKQCLETRGIKKLPRHSWQFETRGSVFAFKVECRAQRCGRQELRMLAVAVVAVEELGFSDSD